MKIGDFVLNADATKNRKIIRISMNYHLLIVGIECMCESVLCAIDGSIIRPIA